MRFPAVAGRFYPAEERSLIHEIENCFLHPLGPGLPRSEGSARAIVSVVAPHAGYRASGMNAAHAYKAIKEDGLPEAYIIIGPDHHGVPYNAVLCSEPYLTPLGECKIHEEIADRLGTMIADDPTAHAFEHSVEVQAPFLQFIDNDPKIVPIIMRNQDMRAAEKLAGQVREACDGFDVIVIASSDLSHYVPKDAAAKADGELIDRALDTDIPGMYMAVDRLNISACGYGSIATSILSSEPSSSKLLKYSNSFDSLGGDGSEVVGYASMVFMR